jgi:hypothetical protein
MALKMHNVLGSQAVGRRGQSCSAQSAAACEYDRIPSQQLPPQEVFNGLGKFQAKYLVGMSGLRS